MTHHNHSHTVCDVLAELARDDMVLVMIAPGDFKLVPRTAGGTRLGEPIKPQGGTALRKFSVTEEAA